MNAPIFTSVAKRIEKKWSQYAEDKRGVAAVEFAMIAAPFFFLIFALLEVCLLFIMSTVMEHAIQESSRMIRTGQAQQDASFDEVAFRQSICDQLFGMMDCDSSKLHIDVQSISNFSGTNTASPLDEDGNFDDAQMGYNPGTPNSVVAVRVFYEWDLITPIISAPLKNMAGNKHLISSTTVFRNEPYGQTGSAGSGT